MASQVKSDYMVIAGEKWSYQLPVEKRAPQAVQKDDAHTRATEVAYSELHSAEIHNEVYRVVRQIRGDGTISRRVGSPTRADTRTQPRDWYSAPWTPSPAPFKPLGLY